MYCTLGDCKLQLDFKSLLTTIGEAEEFDRIKAAHSMLSSPVEKKMYDEWRKRLLDAASLANVPGETCLNQFNPFNRF